MSPAFTLLELVITITILCILTAIAYPQYNQHIVKTRRSDAKTSLYQLAANLEEHHTQHNTYAQFTLPKQGHSNQGFYQLQLLQADSQGYLLEAKPIGPQQADQQCRYFRLNDLGLKNSSKRNCW